MPLTSPEKGKLLTQITQLSQTISKQITTAPDTLKDLLAIALLFGEVYYQACTYAGIDPNAETPNSSINMLKQADKFREIYPRQTEQSHLIQMKCALRQFIKDSGSYTRIVIKLPNNEAVKPILQSLDTFLDLVERVAPRPSLSFFDNEVQTTNTLARSLCV